MKIVRILFHELDSWGILEDDNVYALVGDVYGEFFKGGLIAALSQLKLLPPVTPTITVGCGRNYLDHIEEMGWPIPKEPALFFKPPNALIGPQDDIVYPAASRDLRCEAELCLVIKRRAKNVSEEEALDYVLGYTCGNDLTAFDLARRDGHSVRSKAFDTAGVLGPCIVTDIDPHNLAIRNRINGETRQNGNTRQMIHGPEKLVSYISAFMTLNPGDVIWTGTPLGGATPVKVGDQIEVKVEGIGTLCNRVAAPQASPLLQV